MFNIRIGFYFVSFVILLVSIHAEVDVTYTDASIRAMYAPRITALQLLHNETERSRIDKLRFENLQEWYNITIHNSKEVLHKIITDARDKQSTYAHLPDHIANFTVMFEKFESLPVVGDVEDAINLGNYIRKLGTIYEQYGVDEQKNPSAEVTYLLRSMNKIQFQVFLFSARLSLLHASYTVEREVDKYIATLSTQQQQEQESDIIEWYKQQLTKKNFQNT